MLADERAVDGRVHQHEGGGHGAFGGQARSQTADRREMRYEARRSPEPVAFGLGVHDGGLRVCVRSHEEYVGEGGRPLLQVSDEPCPAGHELAGIGQPFHLRDDRSFGHRHRFVIADQGPVQGELEEGRLPADGGEHRLAAHLGAGGHGVDGRS